MCRAGAHAGGDATIARRACPASASPLVAAWPRRRPRARPPRARRTARATSSTRPVRGPVAAQAQPRRSPTAPAQPAQPAQQQAAPQPTPDHAAATRPPPRRGPGRRPTASARAPAHRLRRRCPSRWSASCSCSPASRSGAGRCRPHGRDRDRLRGGDRGARRRLAARAAPRRRRPRLRRAGRRQDDLRARRGPRARRARAGDEPDLHDRAALRGRPRRRSATSTSIRLAGPRRRGARAARRRARPATASRSSNGPSGRSRPAGDVRVAAHVRLEHLGGDRRRVIIETSILGLDTATPATVVAVLPDDGEPRGAAPRAARAGERPGHAAQLLPLARRALEARRARTSPTCAASASASGPAPSRACGSASRPRARWPRRRAPRSSPVSTLEALADGGRAATAPVLAVLDARRGEAFAAAFRDGERLLAPRGHRAPRASPGWPIRAARRGWRWGTGRYAFGTSWSRRP